MAQLMMPSPESVRVPSRSKRMALGSIEMLLPVILSSGVILGVETDNALLSSIQDAIEETQTGPSITDAIKNILITSGIGARAFETVFEIVEKIYDVAIASGIQIIIFLSGLQTISVNMYEAADIEGCTAWESLWKITFPMISSLFLVNWIYTIIDFCMRSDNKVMEKISEEMIEGQKVVKVFCHEDKIKDDFDVIS